ncbi:SDR family NAD(P)-dependent oxidoreductase (plasmid) [Azospirillum brasilense]|uniref:SDR family NAD(P)-dependent oxidoreductase n=1 Tax=Azospirillum brasilense TaxID=192 RepID=A0A4D8R466_AZOBR|nr:SDR family NAD(P)-dependent oxidoreductase [Azospirillum brasilense]QCO18135.1 SDR family NAD(P)-dependent oxidoreductase [Azospirillum brasilense]
MDVLVTGGAGFIGSHITHRLVSLGHRVTVIDNESTGLRANVPAEVRYIRGDVTNPADLDKAFEEVPDAVIHIAGQVSIIRAFSNPVGDLRTNVEGTVNVLQQCVERGVKRLLYASSMSAYGNAEVVPTPEDTPCSPVSYYGVTKYAGERYVHLTAARPDLPGALAVTSFRMYNVYGPRQAVDNPYQGVLGIFLGNIIRGEPIRIYGDGKQTRDFVFIDDVVDAWVGALDNPASHGKIFNLGSGRQTSISELADLALGALGRTRADHPVLYHPERPGEQRSVQADVTYAGSVLGWTPRTRLEQGLVETVRWALRENGRGDGLESGPESGIAERAVA